MDNFSIQLANLYQQRRDVNGQLEKLNEHIEKLELVEAKKIYDSMNREADNTIHGPANAAVCKEFDFHLNAHRNSPNATLAQLKKSMMQHLMAYQIFDKIPYEMWDKYCAAIYEQCDMVQDSSIQEEEFWENRQAIIDEANDA